MARQPKNSSLNETEINTLQANTNATNDDGIHGNDNITQQKRTPKSAVKFAQKQRKTGYNFDEPTEQIMAMLLSVNENNDDPMAKVSNFYAYQLRTELDTLKKKYAKNRQQTFNKEATSMVLDMLRITDGDFTTMPKNDLLNLYNNKTTTVDNEGNVLIGGKVVQLGASELKMVAIETVMSTRELQEYNEYSFNSLFEAVGLNNKKDDKPLDIFKELYENPEMSLDELHQKFHTNKEYVEKERLFMMSLANNSIKNGLSATFKTTNEKFKFDKDLRIYAGNTSPDDWGNTDPTLILRWKYERCEMTFKPENPQEFYPNFVGILGAGIKDFIKENKENPSRQNMSLDELRNEFINETKSFGNGVQKELIFTTHKTKGKWRAKVGQTVLDQALQHPNLIFGEAKNNKDDTIKAKPKFGAFDFDVSPITPSERKALALGDEVTHKVHLKKDKAKIGLDFVNENDYVSSKYYRFSIHSIINTFKDNRVGLDETIDRWTNRQIEIVEQHKAYLRRKSGLSVEELGGARFGIELDTDNSNLHGDKVAEALGLNSLVLGKQMLTNENKERTAKYIGAIYYAFNDMGVALNYAPKAFGLNGTATMSIGAYGRANSNAYNTQATKQQSEPYLVETVNELGVLNRHVYIDEWYEHGNHTVLKGAGDAGVATVAHETSHAMSAFLMYDKEGKQIYREKDLDDLEYKGTINYLVNENGREVQKELPLYQRTKNIVSGVYFYDQLFGHNKGLTSDHFPESLDSKGVAKKFMNTWNLGVEQELIAEKAVDLFKAIAKNTYLFERSKMADEINGKKEAYYATGEEIMARIAEVHVQQSLAEKNMANKFLVDVISIDDYPIKPAYPYLTIEEYEKVKPQIEAVYTALATARPDVFKEYNLTEAQKAEMEAKKGSYELFQQQYKERIAQANANANGKKGKIKDNDLLTAVNTESQNLVDEFQPSNDDEIPQLSDNLNEVADKEPTPADDEALANDDDLVDENANEASDELDNKVEATPAEPEADNTANNDELESLENEVATSEQTLADQETEKEVADFEVENAVSDDLDDMFYTPAEPEADTQNPEVAQTETLVENDENLKVLQLVQEVADTVARVQETNKQLSQALDQSQQEVQKLTSDLELAERGRARTAENLSRVNAENQTLNAENIALQEKLAQEQAKRLEAQEKQRRELARSITNKVQGDLHFTGIMFWVQGQEALKNSEWANQLGLNNKEVDKMGRFWTVTPPADYDDTHPSAKEFNQLNKTVSDQTNAKFCDVETFEKWVEKIQTGEPLTDTTIYLPYDSLVERSEQPIKDFIKFKGMNEFSQPYQNNNLIAHYRGLDGSLKTFDYKQMVLNVAKNNPYHSLDFNNENDKRLLRETIPTINTMAWRNEHSRTFDKAFEPTKIDTSLPTMLCTNQLDVIAFEKMLQANTPPDKEPKRFNVLVANLDEVSQLELVLGALRERYRLDDKNNQEIFVMQKPLNENEKATFPHLQTIQEAVDLKNPNNSLKKFSNVYPIAGFASDKDNNLTMVQAVDRHYKSALEQQNSPTRSVTQTAYAGVLSEMQVMMKDVRTEQRSQHTTYLEANNGQALELQTILNKQSDNQQEQEKLLEQEQQRRNALKI